MDFFPDAVVALAALLALIFLVATALARRKRDPVRSAGGSSGNPAEPAGALLVAFASQSGLAETIAWKTAEAAQRAGNSVTLTQLGSISPGALRDAGKVLFVVSTTGDGDPPDNARAFAHDGMKRSADLAALRYGLLALGDRSYSRFCGFGRRLDRWLAKSRARPMFPLIEVDNADAGALADWYRQLGALGLVLPGADAARCYSRWRIDDRILLNSGSPGGPVYLVVLVPADTPPLWQAGDIAEVFPGPASRAFLDERALAPRDYTVASLPGDGRLELVVRRHSVGQDAGRASSWLTEGARLGERIALRIRSNSGFHGPAADAPMILIGSGTGIAGLRGHLKARAAAGRHRNWLVFGERTSAHDWLFRDEIERWRSSGHISRLDTAFSRDPGEPTYVQDCLSAARKGLLEWVEDGASIYVCGSRHGMAEGVARALIEILGEERLDMMTTNRRYCRDVY